MRAKLLPIVIVFSALFAANAPAMIFVTIPGEGEGSTSRKTMDAYVVVETIDLNTVEIPSKDDLPLDAPTSPVVVVTVNYGSTHIAGSIQIGVGNQETYASKWEVSEFDAFYESIDLNELAFASAQNKHLKSEFEDMIGELMELSLLLPHIEQETIYIMQRAKATPAELLAARLFFESLEIELADMLY